MTGTSMPLPAMEQPPTSVPPAVLLANHLKALKLPTFVREYEKVAFGFPHRQRRRRRRALAVF